MSKCIYGVEFLRQFDPKDPEHVRRKGRLCELPSGPKLLQDAFDCILARVLSILNLLASILPFLAGRESKGIHSVLPEVQYRTDEPLLSLRV